jgi:hypothetical protein
MKKQKTESFSERSYRLRRQFNIDNPFRICCACQRLFHYPLMHYDFCLKCNNNGAQPNPCGSS